jgi:hypothetical protein
MKMILKKIWILAFVICVSSMLKAQTPVFVMSSIGAMPGTNSTISAMNFKSDAACLDVQTGVVVLRGERNMGEFAMNCEVTMKFNTLGVKLFPNPVRNATKVKLLNAPPLTETFNLSVWNTEGAMVASRKENGYNLFQGLTLDLSALTAGTYVLKIESSNFVDAVKFIKAN